MHDKKAGWRPSKPQNQEESLELFFRKIYNFKTGTFKNEILALCDEMNVEPDYLKPRTLDEFRK